MLIMKFGGTSVAGCEPIRRVVEIVRGRLDKTPVVVVSAMSKITDLLYKISDAAACSDAALSASLVEELRARHLREAEALLGDYPEYLAQANEKIGALCERLASFVSAVAALGELSERSKATIVSNGELLSSTLICYALNAYGISTEWVDARQMIKTDSEYMKGEPDFEAIQALVPGVIAKAFEGRQAVITQGFISSDDNGTTTVLGRGGSDYSASLIGMAVDASRIEIWTDVDGVLTADPRMVPGAKKLDRLSFEEAAEMAHFGAKVLHPMTIEPAVRKNIPIVVLNSLNPSNEGTLILQSDQIEDGVKSVSYKENILVINIFSTKMINATGFLHKVFGIFAKYNVSVDLISTSEANITVTCDAGAKNVDKVMADLSAYAEVECENDKSQISVVGKNIVNIEGMHRDVFGAMASKTYMVSQGASYNLSIVVERTELKQTVCNIHKALFE